MVALAPTQLAIIGRILQAGVIDSVHIYDIPEDSWKKVASLPKTIDHGNAAAVDGKIYVLGSVTGANWAGTLRSWFMSERVGGDIFDTPVQIFGEYDALKLSEMRTGVAGTIGGEAGSKT
ncbi:hypothetical protein B0T26DRAFT_872662 [Lasiosphaeria miniovina]|uniref:Galactose oxidase n=1 Tax=Lasiosphaeria miniovina TaxID=1954250 RepID=A0AA40AMD8_9PEZI|nr:uncharacterized protein B0T26DRAFT_872662 [Lasiosphaeria miniovina]KAK0718464.1 hypothetical protein B0T26DRAFT_872662 [Lasiosphaeria miniovina]